MQESNTFNRFMVSGRFDGGVHIPGKLPNILTKEEALNLAAWLVILADPTGLEFKQLWDDVGSL